jgi:hypothetical protein
MFAASLQFTQMLVREFHQKRSMSTTSRNRLQRLVSKTESVWRELPVKRHKAKRRLSETELYSAQFELMMTAFCVAESALVGKKEVAAEKHDSPP